MRRIASLVLVSSTVLAACLSSPCATAGVIVVDAANGPGTDFTSLFQAANVAASGDTLLVRSGTYSLLIVDGKSLVVVADTNANVALTERVIARNLQPGQSVVVRGLDVKNATSASSGALIYDTLGGVWLEDSSFEGAPSYPGVQQLNATLIVAQRIQARGGDAVSNLFTPPSSGGIGFYVSTFSGAPFVPTACIWDSRAFGGHGADGTGNKSAGHGGSCVAAGFGSAMHLDGLSGLAGNGGNQMVGGAFQTLFAGSGGSGLWVNSNPVAAAGPVAYRDLAMVPGAGGVATAPLTVPGANGVLVQDFGGISTALPGTIRRYEASSPARVNQTATLDFDGQPNELVLLLGSLSGPQQALAPAQPAGALVLPLPFIVLGTIPLGPTGDLQLSVPIAPLPVGVDSVTLWTQALFLTSTGAQFGAGSAITLLAPGF